MAPVTRSERWGRRGGWRDLAVGLTAASLDWVTRDTHLVWRWGGHVPFWAGMGFCLVGAGLLLARRRHPGPVLALAWCYALGRVAMHGMIPWAVPLVALQAYAARRHRRRALLGALALAVPFGFNILDSHELAEGDHLSVASSVACIVLLTVGAYLLGRREREQVLAARLAEERLDVVAAETLAAERRRIARELHDNLGHAITAMSLQAAGARAVSRGAGATDPRVVAALEAIEQTGSGAMRELHRLLGVLRSQGDVADTEASAPGLANLGDLVAGARTGGLVVAVTTVGEPRPLDTSVDYAAYRVVQEALANAMRHDGPGSLVDVTVEHRADGLRVSVRSVATRGATGSGSTGGFGLSGLRERVVLVGGRFDAEHDGTAFVTTASFPTRPGRTDRAGRPGADGVPATVEPGEAPGRPRSPRPTRSTA